MLCNIYIKEPNRHLQAIGDNSSTPIFFKNLNNDQIAYFKSQFKKGVFETYLVYEDPYLKELSKKWVHGGVEVPEVRIVERIKELPPKVIEKTIQVPVETIREVEVIKEVIKKVYINPKTGKELSESDVANIKAKDNPLTEDDIDDLISDVKVDNRYSKVDEGEDGPHISEIGNRKPEQIIVDVEDFNPSRLEEDVEVEAVDPRAKFIKEAKENPTKHVSMTEDDKEVEDVPFVKPVTKEADTEEDVEVEAVDPRAKFIKEAKEHPTKHEVKTDEVEEAPVITEEVITEEVVEEVPEVVEKKTTKSKAKAKKEDKEAVVETPEVVEKKTTKSKKEDKEEETTPEVVEEPVEVVEKKTTKSKKEDKEEETTPEVVEDEIIIDTKISFEEWKKDPKNIKPKKKKKTVKAKKVVTPETIEFEEVTDIPEEKVEVIEEDLADLEVIQDEVVVALTPEEEELFKDAEAEVE